jgi:cyclic-di-GMP phosphodiesterase TipF (flagellum assembly factor)
VKVSPAEAIMAALVFWAVAFVLLERSLRQRAESRLEKAIEDLSRLLATDAQAGATLGQRINALTDLNTANRLEGVEADISVLGTVIRQVAEAVADIEARNRPALTGPDHRPHGSVLVTPAPAHDPEPSIPLDALRQALGENRLVYHVQPVVTLPQRRPHGYDLVPRLMLENGGLIDRPEFMPRKGGSDVLCHIEGIGLMEAVTIGRRARSAGQPVSLFIPLSRATFEGSLASEQLLVSLEANRAIAAGFTFLVAEAEWQALTTSERAIADALVKKGAGFSLTGVKSLRADVSELAGQGVRSLRVDAASFIATPEAFTDFHAADIANYLSRFGVTLMAAGVASEHQILELLDIGITLIQGPHIAAPGPIRPDLLVDRPRTAPLRRAER